jgi:hypothetical protein
MFEIRTEGSTRSDPLAHDRVFSTTCPRCGGRFAEAVAYCPHCGVNLRDALNQRARTQQPNMASAFAPASAVGGSAAAALDELQRLPRPTLLFESPDSYPNGKVRSPLRTLSQICNVKPNNALISCAFVVLFGASVVLQRHESAAALEQHTAQTVQGSVIAQSAGSAESPNINSQTVTAAQAPTVARESTPAQDAKTASNPALPRTPAAAARTLPQTPAVAATTLPQTPAVSAPAPSTAVAEQPPRSAPNEAPHGDRRSKLLSLALARAHDGLDNNDLRKARSGVFWALSLEHDNSEALALKQELLSRENAHNGT